MMGHGNGSTAPGTYYQMGCDFGRGDDKTCIAFRRGNWLAGLFVSDPRGSRRILGIQGYWEIPFALTATPAGGVE